MINSLFPLLIFCNRSLELSAKFLHKCFDEFGGRYNTETRNDFVCSVNISKQTSSMLSVSKSFLLT